MKGRSKEESQDFRILVPKQDAPGAALPFGEEKGVSLFFRELGSESEERHRLGGLPGEEPQGLRDLIPPG